MVTEDQIQAMEHDLDRDGVEGLAIYEVIALIAEVRRLRTALEDYGSHGSGCAMEYRNECTCGLLKTLKRGE